MLNPASLQSITGQPGDSLARRSELIRSVSTLLAMTSERCSPEQIDIYDSVLFKLADMVEEEARAAAAEKIAPLRRAPEHTIRKLAQDKIAVARPILQQSPVLNDLDLIELIAHSRDHMEAVAGRAMLSERVTDRLVESGDDAVHARVAGNHGALISPRGFDRLLERASELPDVAEHLAARLDTPERVIRRLTKQAAGTVARKLKAEGNAAEHLLLERARQLASERMAHDYWLSFYDFEGASARLARIGGQQIVSEHLMNRFAQVDRFAEVTCCFALLLNIPLDLAVQWLSRMDLAPFLNAARAHNFRSSTVQALLKVGPWKHRLRAAQRAGALESFAGLDRKAASIAFRKACQNGATESGRANITT